MKKTPKNLPNRERDYRPASKALAVPITGAGETDGTLPIEQLWQEALGRELLDVALDLMKPPIGFGEFVETMKHWTLEEWEWDLCNRLERLVTERGQLIKIHKPPRFGGSTIVSECFPAYMMGRDPMYMFRQITHTQKHSEEFSETVQALIEMPEYQKIFPGTSLPRQTNVTEWNTTRRDSFRGRESASSYRAIGIHAQGVGFGGNTIVVDDPYSNDKDAYSPTTNDDLRRWHRKTLMNRLDPESNLIVMYHRYHSDDYGAFLDSEGGFETRRYAALLDNEEPYDPMGRNTDITRLDEPLAPGRFSWDFLNKIREKDPERFYSLYQGLPENPEGNAVHRNWFPYQYDFEHEGIPAFEPQKMMGAEIYFDVGASSRGDETVATLGCSMPDETYTWLWQMTGRWNPGERDDNIVDFCVAVNRHVRAMALLEEGIGLGKESIERIVAKIRSKGVAADTVRSVGSKWERAIDREDSFRSAAQAHRVRLYCGDFLKPVIFNGARLENARIVCWEPYLREVTQLKVQKVGDRMKLVGKDNKWDSGTGLHNGLIKLSAPVLTFEQRAAIGRRFGR
jgi:hypothetical protein